MDINAVVAALRETCPGRGIELRAVPIADTFVALPPDCVRPAVGLLVERFDLRHLSTITGEDTGGEIVLLYHFWDGQGLTLRVLLSRERAQVETLIDLIPGAAYYEREVSEMLHVGFAGHAHMRPLFLSDDWSGEPPLRREFAGQNDRAKGDS